MPSLLPLSPFFYCHPEPLFYCHPERSEGSLGAYAPRDDKKESLGITLRKMSSRAPFFYGNSFIISSSLFLSCIYVPPVEVSSLNSLLVHHLTLSG